MRLIVCDIDGTLIDGRVHELNQETIDTFNRILEQGDAICLASGRPFFGVKKYIENLVPGKKFVICGNGAACFDFDYNKIYEVPITMSDLYYLYDKYYQPGITVYGYDDNNGLFIFGEDKYTKLEQVDNRITNLINLDDRTKFDPSIKVYKVMFACDEKINKNLCLDEEDLKRFSSSRSASFYFEVIHHDANKGIQVEKLRKYLGIDKNDVFVFGDNNNDESMFERFTGIALGNAIDDLKKKAKYITKPVQENGFVYAIYEILHILKK